jgi:hypothetical protein
MRRVVQAGGKTAEDSGGDEISNRWSERSESTIGLTFRKARGKERGSKAFPCHSPRIERAASKAVAEPARSETACLFPRFLQVPFRGPGLE